MVIKESGFGEVLPSADAFILDEAHQLPEIASHFFGLSLSSRQLMELARDTCIEQVRDAPDFPVLAERALKLEKTTADFRLALGQDQRRAPWAAVSANAAVVDAINAISQALQELNEALKEAAVRGKGLESCQARCDMATLNLRHFTDPGDDENVQWFETRSKGFSLNSTPLEVGASFRSRMEQYQSSWIFTSATLAVGEDFDHFIHRLGLHEPKTLRLESPFDYARNAILYHPKDLPEPTAQHYTKAVLEAALPVLEASRGRAFILFTSHQALQEAAAWLDGRLEYPLLIQGSLPKTALLERFRLLGNAVLLGTASFWEGVDVRGDTLSCVIIVKLPFASPNDPILQARITALRQRGGNAFMEYQLPQAVIALNQGVGRLIRDIHDRGVLMLCDPRLLRKSYGQVFLKSLPPMTRTRSLDQVKRFFDEAAPVVSAEAAIN
jgi:ATP-dependent DNA helicase DinG